jgi:hypothetical protein
MTAKLHLGRPEGLGLLRDMLRIYRQSNQDLTAFRDLWLAHPVGKHIVHYEDLVRDPQSVLAGIERYWSLPASGVTELLKRKYTRLGDRSLAEHKATEALWKETGRDAD